MTEAFLKEKLLDVYHQLCYGTEENIHGESQAYLYLPNGRYIEVTYKEKETPYFVWQVRCIQTVQGQGICEAETNIHSSAHQLQPLYSGSGILHPGSCADSTSCGGSNCMLKRYAKERATCLFWNEKRLRKVQCNFFVSLPESNGSLPKSCRSITDVTSMLQGQSRESTDNSASQLHLSIPQRVLFLAQKLESGRNLSY